MSARVPGVPELGKIWTPGALDWSKSPTLLIAVCRVIASASIVVIGFPRVRLLTGPGVPVTTTASSSMAVARRRSSACAGWSPVTVTRCSAGENPIIFARTTTSPTGMSVMAKPPLASVSAARLPPAMNT